MPTTKPHEFPSHPAFADVIEAGRKTQYREVIRDGLPRWELFNTRPLGNRIEALFYHEETARELEIECPRHIGEIVTFQHAKGRYRITNIRAEALQDISCDSSEDDGRALTEAVDEGLSDTTYYLFADGRRINADSDHDCDKELPDRCQVVFSHPLSVEEFSEPWKAFADLWDDLYPSGPKSWDANPTVWVYEFERDETNAAETRGGE